MHADTDSHYMHIIFLTGPVVASANTDVQYLFLHFLTYPVDAHADIGGQYTRHISVLLLYEGCP